MTDWEKFMFLLLMCFMTVCAEDHKVVLKIFLEKEPWLLCNKWKRDLFPDSLTSSEYLCTAYSQSTSLQINCSYQSRKTQGKSRYELYSSGFYLSRSKGPLTSVSVVDPGGKEEEKSDSTTQSTASSLESIYSKTPSKDSTTPSQEYQWLTQASKECTNCSGDHCKEICAGGIIVAVIVSFLVGVVTGVAILVLIYSHRTKRLCFQTKPKIDVKVAAQTVLSERVVESGSGPVIGEISKEVRQYEDLSSNVRQTRTYDVLKHETVADGVRGGPGYNCANVYDSIRNSTVSNELSILESDPITNSHCITKPQSYEPVEIGDSGFPILTTNFKHINGSAKDMSFSGDKSAYESNSHDYFILEATPGVRCIDSSIDLCSGKETGNRPNPAKYPLDSQSETENSSKQNDPQSYCRQSHFYYILEAQKNQSDETVVRTEENICTYMNSQTAENLINTQYETKEKSHESFTSNEPSIEKPDHVYFVLERHDR
ncbi:hypothetical protein CHS0354_013384 [Potamilus streckersoni]|uniref:Uncharacterized protein n=1 Tax=Potamilus streckersoni TaxID=2493646 RepID=A0AAE0RW48_9BIVA|nr:hypothetical protein CHS0354_013384 [Potamilus streckersoni]